MIRILVVLLLFQLLLDCNSASRKNNSEGLTKVNESTTQNLLLKQSTERGALVYEDFCMQCHLANGEGVSGTFPPLAKSNWLIDKRVESIHAVKFGQQGEISVNGEIYNGIMVPMGLTDEEIADVMNYIMNSWGNTQDKMVTPEEVSKVLKD